MRLEVPEIKSMDCKMGKRILIFKQLFFLNFRAIMDPKSVCHYIWLGVKKKRNQPKFAPKRSPSPIDSSSSPPPLPHLSPNASPSSCPPPSPLSNAFSFFLLLCYTLLFPPPAHIACLAPVFTPRYFFLYLHLFTLIVPSLLSPLVQFSILSLTVSMVL